MVKPTVEIKGTKSWWSGDNRVEEFMPPVFKAINKYHEFSSPEFTDIYNRAYEAVHAAILEHTKRE